MNAEFIYTAFPEIFLAVAGMALLMFGVMRGDKAAHMTSLLAVLALLVAVMLLTQLSSFMPLELKAGLPNGSVLDLKPNCYACSAFNHMFVHDDFARFVKIILLIGAALSLMLSWAYLWQENLEKPEYPALVIFATVGMMLMVSAGDFISLYVGLELQSLALYVLAAFRRDDAKSSEAGLKSSSWARFLPALFSMVFR